MLGREGQSHVLITHVLLTGLPESPETTDGRSQEVFVHEMEMIIPTVGSVVGIEQSCNLSVACH